MGKQSEVFGDIRLEPQLGSQTDPLRRRPLPRLPREWEEYSLCVILHMVLPLLPLGIEFWWKLQISETSVTLAAAMYSIGIGLSSRSRLQFSVTLIISILFSAAFGITIASTRTDEFQTARLIGMISITLVFLLHAAERYNRHVVECTPFLEFLEWK